MCWSPRFYHECNFFQANEGNLDPSHVSYLHRQANVPDNLKRTVTGSDGKLPLALYDADMAPRIDAEETDYGVRIFSLREYCRRPNLFPRHQLRLAQQGDDPRARCPATATIFTGMCPSTTRTIGATTSCFAAARPWSNATSRAIGKSWTSSTPATGPNATRAIATCRTAKSMKSWSFSGMGRIFNVHDAAIVEGCGEIVDRSQGILRPERQSHHRRAPPALAGDPRRRSRQRSAACRSA